MAAKIGKKIENGRYQPFAEEPFGCTGSLGSVRTMNKIQTVIILR